MRFSKLTNKSIEKEYITLFDSEKLCHNLALAGLYLAVFELLQFSVVEQIKGFFLIFLKARH